MLKKEIIWREILIQARTNKKRIFTQKELAQKFGFSLSTVFNALKIPRENGSIKVNSRFFTLENYKKLLYLWANERSLKREIVYSARLDSDILNLEKEMPSNVIFGLYSAYKFIYKDAPADYDHLYVYSDAKDLKELQKRLLTSSVLSKTPRLASNFFILESDLWLKGYSESMPLEQIFVDIWNSQEWYAKDFLKALEQKLNL